MALILRLLLIALFVWLGYKLVRKLITPPAQLPPADTPPQVMQRCAYCEVHVPAGESTQSRGKVFCSEAHRDAWFRDHPYGD